MLAFLMCAFYIVNPALFKSVKAETVKNVVKYDKAKFVNGEAVYKVSFKSKYDYDAPILTISVFDKGHKTGAVDWNRVYSTCSIVKADTKKVRKVAPSLKVERNNNTKKVKLARVVIPVKIKQGDRIKLSFAQRFPMGLNPNDYKFDCNSILTYPVSDNINKSSDVRQQHMSLSVTTNLELTSDNTSYIESKNELPKKVSEKAGSDYSKSYQIKCVDQVPGEDGDTSGPSIVSGGLITDNMKGAKTYNQIIKYDSKGNVLSSTSTKVIKQPVVKKFKTENGDYISLDTTTYNAGNGQYISSISKPTATSFVYSQVKGAAPAGYNDLKSSIAFSISPYVGLMRGISGGEDTVSIQDDTVYIIFTPKGKDNEADYNDRVYSLSVKNLEDLLKKAETIIDNQAKNKSFTDDSYANFEVYYEQAKELFESDDRDIDDLNMAYDDLAAAIGNLVTREGTVFDPDMSEAKTALENLVKKAQEILSQPDVSDKYTEASLKTLSEATKAAEQALKDGADDLKTPAAVLQAAINGLTAKSSSDSNTNNNSNNNSGNTNNGSGDNNSSNNNGSNGNGSNNSNSNNSNSNNNGDSDNGTSTDGGNIDDGSDTDTEINDDEGIDENGNSDEEESDVSDENEDEGGGTETENFGISDTDVSEGDLNLEPDVIDSLNDDTDTEVSSDESSIQETAGAANDEEVSPVDGKVTDGGIVDEDGGDGDDIVDGEEDMSEEEVEEEPTSGDVEDDRVSDVSDAQNDADSGGSGGGSGGGISDGSDARSDMQTGDEMYYIALMSLIGASGLACLMRRKAKKAS